jgi:hypothetical protein
VLVFRISKLYRYPDHLKCITRPVEFQMTICAYMSHSLLPTIQDLPMQRRVGRAKSWRERHCGLSIGEMINCSSSMLKSRNFDQMNHTTLPTDSHRCRSEANLNGIRSLLAVREVYEVIHCHFGKWMVGSRLTVWQAVRVRHTAIGYTAV